MELAIYIVLGIIILFLAYDNYKVRNYNSWLETSINLMTGIDYLSEKFESKNNDEWGKITTQSDHLDKSVETE